MGLVFGVQVKWCACIRTSEPIGRVRDLRRYSILKWAFTILPPPFTIQFLRIKASMFQQAHPWQLDSWTRVRLVRLCQPVHPCGVISSTTLTLVLPQTVT